jgi:hypothetical protein
VSHSAWTATWEGAIADDRAEFHPEPVGEQRVEPLGFDAREGRPAAHGRELLHRSNHREREIVGDQLFENARVGMVEIFEEANRPFLVLSRSHRLSPVLLSRFPIDGIARGRCSSRAL